MQQTLGLHDGLDEGRIMVDLRIFLRIDTLSSVAVECLMLLSELAGAIIYVDQLIPRNQNRLVNFVFTCSPEFCRLIHMNGR